MSRLLGGKKARPNPGQFSVITHAEDQRDGDGFVVMVLKYTLPASPPDLFTAHAGDIDRWFSTTAFVPISEK